MPYGEQGQLLIQTLEERFTHERISKTKIWKIHEAMHTESARTGRGEQILDKAGFINLRLLKETLL